MTSAALAARLRARRDQRSTPPPITRVVSRPPQVSCRVGVIGDADGFDVVLVQPA